MSSTKYSYIPIILNIPNTLQLDGIRMLYLLFGTSHGDERPVVGEHKTSRHVGTPVGSELGQCYPILPYIVRYELVPGFAGLFRQIFIVNYKDCHGNLLKTSQLCSIEVFENVLNDVVIVSAVKQFIQDTLGFVKLPPIQNQRSIRYLNILNICKILSITDHFFINRDPQSEFSI